MEIETGIVEVFRRNPDMTDYAVLRALDAAVARYKDLARGHTVKPVTLAGLELKLFEGVQSVCERRLQSGVTGQPLPAERVLDIVRRLKSSAEFWNRETGRQGYLTYVDGFIR